VLTLNVGNTHTTLVLWPMNGPAVKVGWRTGERIPAKARKLLSKNVTVVLAGVVPKYIKSLEAGLNGHCRVFRFRKDIPAPIVIVPRPANKVGDDRIAGALGAFGLNRGSRTVLIDAGTAVTINAVRPTRKYKPPRFEGGLILPGASMSFAALATKTAQLPKCAATPLDSKNFIGRSTEEAIRLGVQQGQAAMITELARAQAKQLGAGTKVVLTGGGAEDPVLVQSLKRALGRKLLVARNVVHLGLVWAWQEFLNRRGRS
jgi:pantothenate kinase type III